jgi:flagellar hook-associated protein FlgK
MNLSVSTRIMANALNTASTSREISHEFRCHAKVLNDRLADVLRSGLFDDLDNFFKMLEAHVRNPGRDAPRSD